MATTLPVSRFAQNYNQHLKVAEATDDVLVLRQRSDRPSWVLTSERRYRADAQVSEVLAGTMASLLKEESLLPALIGALTESMPWVSFLPPDDRDEFMRELVQTVRACASVGSNTAVAELIEDWRNTAAIHSDPVLAQSLVAPVEDPLDQPIA